VVSWFVHHPSTTLGYHISGFVSRQKTSGLLPDLRAGWSGTGPLNFRIRVQDARGLCQVFFSWYNTAHHHGGVGLITPAMLHRGEVEAVTQVRKLTLSAAFERHPERFVRGTPRPPVVAGAAWTNRPKTNSSRSEACALAENTLIPRVQGDGSMRDRRSCGILEADFLDPAPRPPGNDTKFVREVSQNY
jgi:putative transposase